jgi:RNA polymerase sigma-70 factor (sigma-E family)
LDIRGGTVALDVTDLAGAPVSLSVPEVMVMPDRVIVELHSLHYLSLVRMATLLVRDRGSAEEIVQDAFLSIHGAWAKLRDQEKAVPYLRQCVVNKSRSVLRRRMVEERYLGRPLPDAPPAEQTAMAILDRSALVSALRTLPARQREAIVLRYYGDLSEADTARAMGISCGAVKSHTARGLCALRTALAESG